MIIGHSDRLKASEYLKTTYQLTKADADDVCKKAEAMGWVPAEMAADEAAAASSNILAVKWGVPFETRKSVVLSIYRRLLGSKAADYIVAALDENDDEMI